MKERNASFRSFYLIKWLFLCLFSGGFVICSYSQSLSTFSLQLVPQKSQFSTADFSIEIPQNPFAYSPVFPRKNALPTGPSLRPAYINPDPGYLSFLCKKELEIEKRSPIDFWFQLGEDDPGILRHQRGGAITTVKLKFRIE